MKRSLKNIAVLVSGGGTNLQALIDAQNSGVIKSGRIVCVVADKPGVYALERARLAGIAAHTIERKAFADRADFDTAVAEYMRSKDIDLVVTAGFMTILGENFSKPYAGKVINVHPALIPSFCGKGFYGLKVHQAALDYGVKLTGATVHIVNEITDGGPIILQKAVDVQDGDTPETLQKRVMEQAEWDILPKAVELFCADRLVIEGRAVRIL